MEEKSEGNFWDVFLHCTLKCLCPYVPTTNFKLMMLWNKVECHRVTMKQTSHRVNSKMQQKITHND